MLHIHKEGEHGLAKSSVKEQAANKWSLVQFCHYMTDTGMDDNVIDEPISAEVTFCIEQQGIGQVCPAGCGWLLPTSEDLLALPSSPMTTY